MIHLTLFTFQMYSSSPRFHHEEPENSINKHKMIKGDQNLTTSKIFTAQYACNNSRMALLHYFQS